MYVVFISTAEDFRKDAPRVNEHISDGEIFDMFNIAMMKVIRVAFMEKGIRKAWRIKKGLFS